MRGTMFVFEPGKEGPRGVPFDRAPKLEELKAAIGGGHLEVVPGFTDIGYQGVVMNCVAFCDEDGKRKEMPVNEIATAFWEHSLHRKGKSLANTPPMFGGPDVLVGSIAVVFGDREFMGSL
jgi:hypothetical protein